MPVIRHLPGAAQGRTFYYIASNTGDYANIAGRRITVGGRGKTNCTIIPKGEIASLILWDIDQAAAEVEVLVTFSNAFLFTS